MNRFEGHACVITGAASGIGAACAEAFVAEGARVLVVDIRQDEGRATAARLGPAAAYQHADVADEGDVAAAVAAAVARFGRLDCMINNAGIAGSGESILTADVADFDRMMGVMARGAFLGTKHAARVMVEQQRGAIINVASIAGTHVGYGTHSYSAAKAAIVQLTRSVAMELAEKQVRVNAILPGPVATPLIGRAFAGEAQQADAARSAIEQALARRQPMGRALRAADVARAALWLAGDESGVVTGHALVVDGGLSGGEKWSRRQHRGAMARAQFKVEEGAS